MVEQLHTSRSAAFLVIGMLLVPIPVAAVAAVAAEVDFDAEAIAVYCHSESRIGCSLNGMLSGLFQDPAFESRVFSRELESVVTVVASFKNLEGMDSETEVVEYGDGSDHPLRKRGLDIMVLAPEQVKGMLERIEFSFSRGAPEQDVIVVSTEEIDWVVEEIEFTLSNLRAEHVGVALAADDDEPALADRDW